MSVAPGAAPSPTAGPLVRLRPQLLAVTPPTGVVAVPDVARGSLDTVASSSWEPLFGHPGFALWLRTPTVVETMELAELAPKERVLAPWRATRYRPVLEVAAAREIRVFIGTCAADLHGALELQSRDVLAALRNRRLAGFILRGDPNEATLTRVRERLDALDAAHLALGRSMHGVPRTIEAPPADRVRGTTSEEGPLPAPFTIADFTVVAPFRAAITPKPSAAPEAVGAPAAVPADPPAPLGRAGLAKWVATRAHVVAMGGINTAAAREAAALGANGIAGIDAFFGDAAGVAQNARAFAALFPPPSS